MNERTRKAIGNMPLNDRRKILGDVVTALSSSVTHGEQSIRIVTVIIEALGPKLHEAMAEPDPVDVAAIERVKVLEHLNDDLRYVIREIRWHYSYSPIGYVPTCQYCGVRQGQPHEGSCIIDKLLNPKTAEPEAPQVVCEKCEYVRPGSLCGRVNSGPWPLCEEVSDDGDCPHFKEKAEPSICCTNCAKSCLSDQHGMPPDTRHCTAAAHQPKANTYAFCRDVFYEGCGSYIAKPEPKTEPEVVEISCENCIRHHPLCRIAFREDCGDFEPKSEEEPKGPRE